MGFVIVFKSFAYLMISGISSSLIGTSTDAPVAVVGLLAKFAELFFVTSFVYRITGFASVSGGLLIALTITIIYMIVSTFTAIGLATEGGATLKFGEFLFICWLLNSL